ncbi:MAG: hypothetical protein GY950_11470, partial [bacterium]|nr:hypothetical protein [bacterium]
LGVKNVERGNNEAPYGYVIPVEQWDRPAAYTFLQKMEEHGVRLFQLEADVRVGNGFYRKGAFVIPLNQRYRSFIKVMMERQHYPEIKHMRNGPIIEPYDACGWTMPLQMGVKSVQLNHPLDGFKLAPVKNLTYPGGTVTGTGAYYCIPARFNRSAILVNRLHKNGFKVYRYTGADADGVNIGDFLVHGSTIKKGKIITLLKGTGVTIKRVDIKEPGYLKEVLQSRIAIYQSYRASMDEGWTRWVLDHFEFNYKVLLNNDFRDKNFSQKYDVVIIPDLGRDAVVKGMASGRWAYYAMSTPPEYKGGIGEKGLAALKHFVQRGGSLVLLDSAAELGIKDFSLPLIDIMKNVKRDTFSCPGSLLKLKVDSTDPIGWGME